MEEDKLCQQSLEETHPVYLTGKWTKQEHQQFIQEYKKHPDEWALISNHIKTRCISQVRSHAQKYFNKLQFDKEKIGTQDIKVRSQNDIVVTRLSSKMDNNSEQNLSHSPSKHKKNHMGEGNSKKDKKPKNKKSKTSKVKSKAKKTQPNQFEDKMQEQCSLEHKMSDQMKKENNAYPRKPFCKGTPEKQGHSIILKTNLLKDEHQSPQNFDTNSSTDSSFFMNNMQNEILSRYPRIDFSHIKQFSVFALIDIDEDKSIKRIGQKASFKRI